VVNGKNNIEELLELFPENYSKDFKSDLENLEEIYKMMNGGLEYPRTQASSEIKEPYEPSPRMYSYEQPSCLGSNFVDDMIELPKSQPKRTYNEDLECEIVMVKMSKCMAWLVRVVIPKCMSWLDSYDEPIGDIQDKVDNLSPQSTPQVLPPFEVEETIGVPMKVEPLDHTKLEDLGLNTCSYDLFPSSREFPSIDEPEPQPLPNLQFLDVNLGDKRGTNPPINLYSPGRFRMKVIFDKKKLRSS
ncbi:hypothetical protein Tco_1100157, partial [Tanacetum coccineum]